MTEDPQRNASAEAFDILEKTVNSYLSTPEELPYLYPPHLIPLQIWRTSNTCCELAYLGILIVVEMA